ncbi:MAG: acyl carrier protein [Myxacorys californica WJT36-NPBG1]|nr:acyl carrier protein [Myxacorys californica WJT36-NPBG1]
MKHQLAADKERRAEEAHQDEERRAEEARRRDAIKAFVPARVQKIVSEQLQVDENKVNLDSHLVKDLGMDEVAWVNLSMELEEEFDIEIPDKIVEDGWITIKNLVNLIQKILLA